MGYSGIELMTVWVNVRSSYFRIGRMSSRANVYWATIRGLLSGQVTVLLGYCLVGLPSGGVTVSRGCLLGEVPIMLMSTRATVRTPFLSCIYLLIFILIHLPVLLPFTNESLSVRFNEGVHLILPPHIFPSK